MKNINFVPEDIQGILSSHKISEKDNEQDVFYSERLFEYFPTGANNTVVAST